MTLAIAGGMVPAVGNEGARTAGAGAGAPHWDALDGLRAIAVLAVMVCHLRFGSAGAGGFLGVDVFFVLSGFLITSLLVTEHERFGRVSLANFYARRSLRLLPALFVVVVACVALVVVCDPRSPMRAGTLHGLPWTLLYVEDLRRALPSFHDNIASAGLLGHTWSLSVEEQFYLLWPPAYLIVRRLGARRGAVGIGMLALAATEEIFRIHVIVSGGSGAWVFYSPALHSDGLLVGCGLALVGSTITGRRRLREHAGFLAAAAPIALALLVALFAVSQTDAAGYGLAIPLAVALTSVVLLAVVNAPVRALTAALTTTPMRWIGQRSYGLYLWHYVLIFGVFAGLQPGTAPEDVAAVVGSFAAAALSWRLVEKPCNDLRHRFRSSGRPTPQPIASLGGSSNHEVRSAR